MTLLCSGVKITEQGRVGGAKASADPWLVKQNDHRIVLVTLNGFSTTLYPDVQQFAKSFPVILRGNIKLLFYNWMLFFLEFTNHFCFCIFFPSSVPYMFSFTTYAYDVGEVYEHFPSQVEGAKTTQPSDWSNKSSRFCLCLCLWLERIFWQL